MSVIEGERVCGVMKMKLSGLQRKPKRKSGQEENEHSESASEKNQNSSSEKSSEKTNRVEKWIIRSRGSDGKLRHLDTVRIKPTPKVLSTYGPGEYSIQKSTGGRFSKGIRITIEETTHDLSSQGLPALNPRSGRLDGLPTAKYPRPPRAQKDRLSPSIAPPSDRKRVKGVPDAIKRPEPQVRIDRPCSTEDESSMSTDDGIIFDVESIVKKVKKLLDREVKGELTGEAGVKPTADPKRETKKHETARNSSGRLQLRSQSEKETMDTRSNNLLENMKEKDGSNYSSPAPTAKSESAPRPAQEKKDISCAKCGKIICGEDELWWFQFSGKTCEYCTKNYCSACFPQHNCPSSELCTHCERRFSNDFVLVAQYCRKEFCSQQCANLCFEKNRDREECWGCGSREEKAEESNQDENSEEVYECMTCGTSFEEDADRNYVCMDCEDNDSFFCSRRCFNRYHRKKGLDHEGITFAKFDRFVNEEDKKGKVVIVRS